MTISQILFVNALSKLGRSYCYSSYNCLDFVREVFAETYADHAISFKVIERLEDSTDELGLNNHIVQLLNRRRTLHVGFKFGKWFIHNSNRSCLAATGVQITPWKVIEDLYYPFE